MYDRKWLDELIRDGVEESLTLEYKGLGALTKKPQDKIEVTKDVSAMANSAGGVIVYGVAEFNDKKQAHLPEKIDGIVRADFPKEWLEHVIQNIRPRLECPITPIDIPPDRVVYVVDIPQSDTAHQATDKRYYKRFNFESVPMEDYEVRDIMGRGQRPVLDIELDERSEWKTKVNRDQVFASVWLQVVNLGLLPVHDLELGFIAALMMGKEPPALNKNLLAYIDIDKHGHLPVRHTRVKVDDGKLSPFQSQPVGPFSLVYQVSDLTKYSAAIYLACDSTAPCWYEFEYTVPPYYTPSQSRRRIGPLTGSITRSTMRRPRVGRSDE